MKDNNNLEKILYSKTTAVVINTIFGIFLWYMIMMICFFFRDSFYLVHDSSEKRIIAGLILFHIVWMALAVIYNRSRYHKCGGGRFFWLSAILPAALLGIILGGNFFVDFLYRWV